MPLGADPGSLKDYRSTPPSSMALGWLLLQARQPSQIPSADTARLELVPTRSPPMRLQTDMALISVMPERGNLPLPIDSHCTQGPPLRRVTLYVAILGVYMNDAVGRKHSVPIRKWILAGHECVRRIPNHFEVRMAQRLEHP